MILYQKKNDEKLHLIVFNKQKLYDIELNYSIYEKELLTIKNALKK